MLRFGKYILLLTVVVELTGCGFKTTKPPVLIDQDGAPSAAPVIVGAATGSPIKHVVVIMQENRSFDNLFNGFPGADTVQSGTRYGATIPLQPRDLDNPQDNEHSHPSFWRDWDQGKNDGFATSAYYYVPKSQTVPYWKLASLYTLGDRMFESNSGPSFVAHQYMIAGQSGNASGNPSGLTWGCDAPSDTRVPILGPNGTDLPGVYPCFDYQTMADLLDTKGVNWRYYAPGTNDGFFVLSAFQAIRHIRFGSDWKQNVITPETQVLTDIAEGDLAGVTWVVPTLATSDHPGSTRQGPDWVASIVNAIGASQYWNSTAIFIAWDDWGGWYDHVPPPQVDAMGLGFRVPVIVVSPYAKRGYISHEVHEFGGFLKYMEEVFGLPTLGTRDSVSDDFSDCFDYTQTPQPHPKTPTVLTPQFFLQQKATGAPDDD